MPKEQIKKQIKKSMKPVLPTLKEKKRYVAFEIISEKQFSNSEVSKSLLDAVINFIGIKGAGGAGVMFIKYNEKAQKGLLRVNNNYVNDIKASLAMITKINEDNVIIRSVNTSGVLRKAALSMAE